MPSLDYAFQLQGTDLAECLKHKVCIRVFNISFDVTKNEKELKMYLKALIIFLILISHMDPLISCVFNFTNLMEMSRNLSLFNVYHV